jgi:thiol-disulfide isomerase/thioredoxin
MVGKPAPDFVLPVVANPSSLGGGGVNATLSQLRGHPVVLDFWATWCPPCRAEVPILEKVSRAWQSQGIVLLGVNVDGLDQGDPRAFAEKHAITYPIVQDASGRVSRAYGIDTLPTVVVVSRDGSILSVQSGVVGEDELGDLVRPAL